MCDPIALSDIVGEARKGVEAVRDTSYSRGPLRGVSDSKGFAWVASSLTSCLNVMLLFRFRLLPRRPDMEAAKVRHCHFPDEQMGQHSGQRFAGRTRGTYFGTDEI